MSWKTFTHMISLAAAIEESSIATTWSRGNGHYPVTQYFKPVTRSISCRTSRPAGSFAGILFENTSAYSRTRSYTGLPDSLMDSHDSDANNSLSADFGSALRGRVICYSLVIKHIWFTVPSLMSRKKCLQESLERLVMEDASRGELATSMYWRLFGLP